jgi:hypothetical protein
MCLPPDPQWPSGELFQGGTAEGNRCFEVPAAEASSLVLIVEESMSIDGDKVFFALQ